MTYTYDALNGRIGEDVNGRRSWTVYDGQNAYADFNGLQARFKPLHHRRGGMDNVLGADRFQRHRRLVPDRPSWDRATSSTPPAPSSSTSFHDSFGDVTSGTNPSNSNRFRVHGHGVHSATGQYYDRARYSTPATGRCDEQDPSGYAAGGHGPVPGTWATGRRRR